MKHICIGKLTIIGSDHGLLPGWRQAIIWTSAGILLNGPIGTNFNEILIEIDAFLFKKIHWKMAAILSDLCNQYTGCWWCGDSRFQGISSRGIDLICSEYSSFSTIRVKTLSCEQNGWHFADKIFKCIFLNQNVWIPLNISLKFVLKVRINNMPALVQIMAWRRPGGKPLSEAMIVYLRISIYICHSASVS